MIDADQSGTIEVSEFIGPLSRWAHDSKTAPRFIKYNMLQTMHLQEDLFDMSIDCFNQLASRIDDLAFELQISRNASKQTTGMRSRETRDSPIGQPDIDEKKDHSKNHPEELDLDGASSETGSSASSGYSAQIGQSEIMDIDQPRPAYESPMLFPKKTKDSADVLATSQQNSLEFCIDIAIAKLEAKMESFLRKIKLPHHKRREPLVISPLASDKPGNGGIATPMHARRRNLHRALHHPDAFRSMSLGFEKVMIVIVFQV